MSNSNDSLYSVRYNKARELYIKTLYSDSAMNLNKVTDQFRDKMNFFGDNIVLATKEGTLKWIKDHIAVTDFESYEAALKDYQLIELAATRQVDENSEFYDYIKDCAMYHKDYRLLPEVCIDVQNTNPELLKLYKKYE